MSYFTSIWAQKVCLQRWEDACDCDHVTVTKKTRITISIHLESIPPCLCVLSNPQNSLSRPSRASHRLDHQIAFRSGGDLQTKAMF